MPFPPQSVQKTRARRVFGEFVVEDAIQENSSLASTSLCYSPSPDISLQSELQEPLKDVPLDDDPPKTIGISARSSSASASTISSHKENSSLSSRNRRVVTSIPKKVPVIRPVASRPVVIIQNKRSAKRRDLVKQTQKNITNATISVNQSLNAARVARKINFEQKSKDSAKVRDHWKEEKEEATQHNAEAEKIRHGLLNLQRQLSSKFQRARAQAEASEKDARLKALTNECDFNSQVYQDQQRKLKEERDRKRRESTQVRAELRVNHRNGEEKLQLIRDEEDQALLQERAEGYKASHHFKKKSAERARKSFAFRGGDATRIRALYDNMKAEDQQREHESIELSLRGAADAEAYRKKCEEERRKSLAFRNKTGHEQRKRMDELRMDELAKEQASINLNLDGARDAEAYRKQMEKERRESLAQRNKTGSEQRKHMEELHTEELAKEQASINLNLDGARDAEAYRRKMAEERRESLAKRHAYAKDQRDVQSDMDTEASNKGHESYELKWAGEKDAEAYKKQLEKERREDLHFRNKESAKFSKVMSELQAIAQEKEAESYVLKWAGERDAKEYLAKCEEERRQSAAFRNKEGRRHRQIEQDQRDKELDQLRDDEVLRAGDHQDTEAYKKACDQRDRNSLVFRRKEANLQRLEKKRQQQVEFEVDQNNQELEDAAHWDVTEYIKDCANRRRQSLACRAKDKRRHRKWEERQADKALTRQMEDTRWRGRDRRNQELARQEERRRIALEALRHAGCSFNVNAFGPLREDFF